MLETALDCIITIDQDSEVVDFNMMAEKTFGIPRYVITGKEITDFIIPYDQREAHQRGMMRYLERGESNILNMRIEMTAMRSDESLFPVEMAIAPIFHSGDKKMFTAYLRDITERKEMLLQLAHQSSHDALTGLYNRRKFEDCLGDALKTAETEEKNHVLCLMDLDRFKVVNDTGGHLAGDDLLRKLTAKLQENVRETDILARLGGDEFGLIMMNASIDEGYDMGEKIRHLINNLGFEWEGKAFDVGVSVGLTEMNKHVDLEHSAVITRADLACYAAKSRGRDLVVVYRDDDEEQNRSFAEMQVVADVKEALEHDNFRLYCQEISPLDDNIEDLHYEILVRMVDGEGKMIPPGLFIPACEKYNLMPQLDRWVIGNAYRFFNEQFKSEPNWERMVFSINLSGNSLTDHSLLDFVREELETHQIPPKNICFEITETAAIDDINTAESFINQMREIGCQFALDDFGSGFSSFGYLKKLKVDFLKIDGQFVRDIAHDPVDYAMVEAINRIGHAVGIRTVAEYVEDMEIMGHLRDIGVDFAQGYAIDKPGPIEDLLKKKRD
jgi:diguanylate cyclase (GGDEF)-like protein/PAS domain S-box-containing protein